MNFFGSSLKIVGRQPSLGNIGNSDTSLSTFELVIDNVINQNFLNSPVVTQHPTTRGTPVTDFTYRMPWRYQIEGLVSASTLSSSLDFNVDSIFGSSNYLSTRFEKFRQALTQKYIFKVYTGVNVFDSMGIVDLQISKMRERYNCLEVMITFQELLVAKTGDLSNTKNNQDRQPVNQGVKNG